MRFNFTLDCEAKAFVKGASYVNDSSLTICEPRQEGYPFEVVDSSEWIVYVFEEDDECPNCESGTISKGVCRGECGCDFR